MKILFKVKIFSLSLFINLVSIAQTNNLPLITDLESEDALIKFNAIGSIISDTLFEYMPYLEESIFLQSNPGFMMLYLDALNKLNSPNIVEITYAYIDSANNFSNMFPPIDPLESKVRAIKILFDHGDTTRANIVFELIDRDKPNISLVGLIPDLLNYIINNIPGLKSRAKNDLLYLSRNWNDDLGRSFCQLYLYENFGSEYQEEFIEKFKFDESLHNRIKGMEYLFKINYVGLNDLLHERLYDEVEPSLRLFIADSLLFAFGSPGDFNTVKAQLLLESEPAIKNILKESIEGYEPFPPKNLNTVLSYIEYTISLCDTLLSYSWLGDQQFKDELQNVLQTAKTNLLAGDSLACRTEVKSFQDSVDFVYKDSLNTDPRFVTIEGWKFLYWNAQYILDRLPEIPIQLVSTYSILATHSLKLNQYSVIVQSGDIGVNEAGLEPFLDPGYELSVGANATTPAGYKVKANRIKLNQNSVINGDIYYNQLNNSQGIINGTETTPLELPLFIELTEFKTSIPGTENIIVSNGQTRVLSPGSYGDVTINKNGTLVLTGGVYHFNGFVGGQQSNINYQSPCEIRIAGKLDIGKLSNVIASDTTTYSAKDIVFYVAGINGTDGTLGATPKAAVIGTECKIKANLYVPNGTLQIKANSEAEGSFIGKDVDIDAGVKVKLNSAWQ